MKVFYLSRTPLENAFGGSLMRFHTVEFLKSKGYEVIVVTPNYSSFEDSFLSAEIKPKQILNIKFLLLLERIGLIGDYLIPWAKVASRKLSTHIKSSDIIISTSGGELGMIYLGNCISKVTNARHIIHLHDPVQYTYFDNHWIGVGFHWNRTSLVEKEISLASKILTTSENALHYLNKINSNSRFQYLGIPVMNDIETFNHKKNTSFVNIMYAGSIGKYQNIEKFIPELLKFNNVFIHIIGDEKKIKKRILNTLKKIDNSYLNRISFYGIKNKTETDLLLLEKADYILISLDYDFLKYNFPSKIYDCLNLAIPALYSLPEGSAKRFLTNYEIGIDISSSTIPSIIPNPREKLYKQMVKNLKFIRTSFLMENLIFSLLD